MLCSVRLRCRFGRSVPMSKPTRRSRRRGVRASRARLEHALTAAGLKTQAALAERIANLENLAAPPKDLVNRVFREQPVDPQSLERIARALGSPAHALYRRSDDVPRSTPAAAPPARSVRAMAATAALAAGALVAFWLWTGRDPPERPGAATTAGTVQPASRFALAILPLDGDTDGVLVAALRKALAPDFALASPSAQMIVDTGRPQHVLARLQVDAAISGLVVRRGRRAGIRIYLSQPKGRRLLWAQSVTLRSFAGRARHVADETARALEIALGRSRETPHYHPNEQALEDDLIGWQRLDRSRTELNVKRALTRFAAALRSSAAYPDALAGLCEALIQESIRGGEQRYLDDAEPQCLHALQIDPRNVEALTAWGDLLRKTGRLDLAAQAYAHALGQSPRHVDALLGRAELELARYRATREASYARAAVRTARSAVAAAPGFWKAPYVLGRMLYYTGHVDRAVGALNDAKALDANEHVLSNLGTFQLCQGDLADALQNYLTVKRTAPAFYVGDVQLGTLRYFLGDYRQAAELFERALERAREGGKPQNHKVWGKLADAYRHTGDQDAARTAYTRAAALAERDAARGDNSANTGAYLAYYYTALLAYDQTGRIDEIAAAIDAQLYAATDGATDVDALIHAVKALALRGDVKAARALYPRITAQCPGFGASPDLAGLRSDAGID